MDKNKKMNPVARYFLNIALSWDQLLNAHGFGDPDETISSRLGKLKRKHSGTIPWYRPVSKYLAWGLNKIDPNHVEEAIEEDEGDNGLFI